MSTLNWCRVCGKEYPVCHVCANTRTYTPWRIICDTNEHYRIWLVVEQYRKGIMSLESAQKQLTDLGCNMNNITDFIPAVRETIMEIIGKAEHELGQRNMQVVSEFDNDNGDGLWPKPQTSTKVNKRKKARS